MYSDDHFKKLSLVFLGQGRFQGFACDVYLKECEQKKHRAFEKFRQEQKINAAKRLEIFKLKKEIQKLKVRYVAFTYTTDSGRRVVTNCQSITSSPLVRTAMMYF